MGFGRNRRALREATAAQHAELDRLVGAFRTRREYTCYLTGIHAFRRSIEPGFEDMVSWRPTLVAHETALDLCDLELEAAPAPIVQTPDSPSARLGRAYVTEGSGLGARVLARSANALGFDERFGARHLWRQANAQENWTALLLLLEANDVDIDAAIHEAMLTFTHAYVAMTAAAQKAQNE